MDVSIPYKSGQHFKMSDECTRIQQAIRRFNPLQIGSTLQKRAVDDLVEPGVLSGFNPLQIGSTLQKYEMKNQLTIEQVVAFQSPTNRVNTSKRYSLSSSAAPPSSVSIPYKSGQHFKIEHTYGTAADLGFAFQSPTNRVNTSNFVRTSALLGRNSAFQSPTNRVNTSKPKMANKFFVWRNFDVSIPYKSGQHFKTVKFRLGSPHTR